METFCSENREGDWIMCREYELFKHCSKEAVANFYGESLKAKKEEGRK